MTDTRSHGGLVRSHKKFFIRYGVVVRRKDHVVFRHEYDARGRPVLVRFAVGTLGDTLAWFPYAVKFAEKHGCRMTIRMDPKISPLFAESYPHINFVGSELEEQDCAAKAYATYALYVFFGDDERNDCPVDYRQVGLHHIAAHILGVSTDEQVPLVTLPDTSRPIPEKYVCIATQASAQVKYWCNPNGWDEVVGFLKGRGYRVICLDRNSVWGCDPLWNRIPPGAEDETGERPLTERCRWLMHADLFIGTSSGLSWLAWTMKCPVVLVSGWTLSFTEFYTPYRVSNKAVCGGCWNDQRSSWSQDWVFCPKFKGTDRELECSKKISGQQVIDAVARCIADKRKRRKR